MSPTSDEKKLYQQLKILSSAFLLPSTRNVDHKSILRTVTKHFKAFTEADASVLMLNDNNEILVPVCSSGIPFSRVKDSTLSLSMRLKDIISRPALDIRYSSFMNTPLIHNRKFIGLSAVFSTIPEKFHTFEHDKYRNILLTILASYYAVSIENTILADSMKLTEHSKSDREHPPDSDQNKKWVQAMQPEKMSALSMSVTEIIHEITNSLSLIASHTQTLLKDAAEKDINALTGIHEQANRAAGFVKGLLNFVQQGNSEKTEDNLY